MSSPPSDSDSQSFALLDERIQRWIWSAGWTALRDAQEAAIPLILGADRDVIIAAATASGKTEAAFFPILTRLLRPEEEGGSVVYISPLKALINDQWGRLSSLCADLEIPVVPWHGDISSTRKRAFAERPSAIVLITPESLEALFMRRGPSMGEICGRVRYVVVDELHAFIGTERGKQLQSLMHRMEDAARARLPRIGLSATLGDMVMAGEFLRPGGGEHVALVVSAAQGQELRVQVRGYCEGAPNIVAEPDSPDTEKNAACYRQIADHLFSTLRGSNNLVFPNSRSRVETLADFLRRRCEAESAPNEFWPHHGSLSKELREETEHALKAGDRPATAICTTTLELGIDIGAVKSVAQVGPPPSVASLRQRLGRSGRREGEPAILRAYCIEDRLTSKSDISDRLREGLVQTIASIRLLLGGWCEPPLAGAMNLSTLVQQVLSVVYERGGTHAAELYRLLVATGPFTGIDRSDFPTLLRAMGEKDLLMQDSSGLLLLGQVGERVTAHYDFYAAFESDEEWQLMREGRLLGTLPIKSPVYEDRRLIFAGRRWRVTHVDAVAGIISVVPDPGGRAPEFDSGRPLVHTGVRQEMRRILESTDDITFANEPARELLQEARSYYRDAGLDHTSILGGPGNYLILPWFGDRAHETLALMLRASSAPSVSSSGLGIEVTGWDLAQLTDAISTIAEHPIDDVARLLAGVPSMERGKWDWVIPEELLQKSYASIVLDIPAAVEAARAVTAR